MQTTIKIGDKLVEFRRHWFTGQFSYVVDGKRRVLQSAWNPDTHFSFRLTKRYSLELNGHELEIVKTRPLLMSGVKAHNYRFYLNGEFVREVEDM